MSVTNSLKQSFQQIFLLMGGTVFIHKNWGTSQKRTIELRGLKNSEKNRPQNVMFQFPEHLDISTGDVIQQKEAQDLWRVTDVEDSVHGDVYVCFKVKVEKMSAPDKHSHSDALFAMNDPMDPVNASEELDVFISHSSKDADVAEVLIELIRAALDIPHAKIRCTSVDGYRLPSGVSTDEQLQKEVRNSRCFIALLTPSSLQSPYVLFELGARWGAKLRLIPLLAKGSSAASLRMPLSALNALACTSSAQLHQLLADIGAILGQVPTSPAAYDRYLQRLCAFEENLPTNDVQHDNSENEKHDLPPIQNIGQEAQNLLVLIEQEPDLEQRGIVEILEEVEPGQTYFFPRLQYAGSPTRIKSRVFRDAIRQLVSACYLHPPEDNPSRNTRTYEYRPIET